MSTQPVLASDQHDNVLVVVPQGDTAGFRTGAIENDLKGILEKMKADDKPYVVVDLGKSRYFGSMVIGAVKTLTNMARERGGELVVCDASPEMLATMNALDGGKSTLMHFDSRKAAVKAINTLKKG